LLKRGKGALASRVAQAHLAKEVFNPEIKALPLVVLSRWKLATHRHKSPAG
jgi:hypothetical protein